MGKLKLEYYILCAVTFFVGLAFYFIVPIIPLILKNMISIQDAEIGLVMGVFSIGALCSRAVAGFFLDRYPRHIVALSSLSVMTIISVAHIFPTGVMSFLAVRIAHGFFWGLTATSLYTIVSDVIPESSRGMGFGIYGSMIILAMSVSPPISISLYKTSSFQQVVFLSAGLACVAILMLAMTISSRQASPWNKPRLGFSEYIKNLTNIRVMTLGMVFFAVSFVFTGVISFILIYAAQNGIQRPGMFFTLYSVATVITRPLQGILYDRYGPARLIIFAALAGIAGFGLLGTNTTYFAYCGGAVLLGVSIGVLFTCPQAMTMGIVAAGNRGAANAQLSFLADVGGLTGGIILGWVAGSFGYSWVFIVSALMFSGLLAYSYFYVLPRYAVWEKG